MYKEVVIFRKELEKKSKPCTIQVGAEYNTRKDEVSEAAERANP